MILIVYLLAAVLLVAGQFLGVFAAVIPLMIGTDVMVTAAVYLQFIGIWIVTIPYLYLTKKNRPILRALGRSPAGNTLGKFLLGLGIGFGLNAVCILGAWLNRDIALYFSAVEPLPLLFLFVAVFIQSAAEEFLCRGFVYQRLRQRYRRPAVAILGNSLLFALLHLMNDGITVLSVLNIMLTGILFSLMILYLDSMWCAMAAHAAWNFTQNIIFGLPNSGIVVPYSVFHLDAASARDSFAYNVGFGVEGTLLADAVLLFACAGLWAWGRKYGKASENILP
ncbi:MAG: CPBP family intramembrane metalloprotease [Clostridium sp.]|nr:CPBP family intramembrane metalloprotease [Acetatifactor muris]MCM1527674.1 CPBP family intramembrane metalloprotease [Bacteroides sp.]MCM1563382.1 CPBP family intramembrane metalloprotease [Clostridium sp.]